MKRKRACSKKAPAWILCFLLNPRQSSLDQETIKSLIHECQTLLLVVSRLAFTAVRIVLTAFKYCRAKYPESRFKHLRGCTARRWWKEIKLLGRMRSATRNDPTSVLKHDSEPDSSLTAHASIINNAFLCHF